MHPSLSLLAISRRENPRTTETRTPLHGSQFKPDPDPKCSFLASQTRWEDAARRAKPQFNTEAQKLIRGATTSPLLRSPEAIFSSESIARWVLFVFDPKIVNETRVECWGEKNEKKMVFCHEGLDLPFEHACVSTVCACFVGQYIYLVCCHSPPTRTNPRYPYPCPLLCPPWFVERRDGNSSDVAERLRWMPLSDVCSVATIF